MKSLSFFLVFVLFGFSLIWAQSTYTVGNTEYYYNQTYSTTGKPKVKRSEANKREFLRSKGYHKTPYGYEVDHIIPLSKGGTDNPSNMQLLTIEQHKAKTARERSSTSTYSSSIPRFTSYSNTTSAPSYYSTSSDSKATRTYYTGARGGKYYINSNGNKTYVKKNKTSNYSVPAYKSNSYYSTPSYKSGSSRTIYTGPRGGSYYINSNGNKTYIKN